MINEQQSIFIDAGYQRCIKKDKFRCGISKTLIYVCLYYSRSHVILRKRACSFAYLPLFPAGSVPRWTWRDLDLVKEGSDLKKERAGKKSSFSHRGYLPPAIYHRSIRSLREGARSCEIYVGQCDRSTVTFLRSFATGNLTRLWDSGSRSGKFDIREEFDLVGPQIRNLTKFLVDAAIHSFLHVRHVSCCQN